MKRCLVLLLALLLAAPCALAEAYIGAAATAVSTSLYDMPGKDAAELMRYFVGVRVEVVREVDLTYVQVNVGEPDGNLMGYMKKTDLVFGEAAIRRVRADEVYCVSEKAMDCTVYGYPDTHSKVVAEGVFLWSVLGMRGSEWLHVQMNDGGTGFISREELPGASLKFGTSAYIRTEPMEGEFTREEAAEIARGELLDCADSSVYLCVLTVQGEQVDAQRLGQCTPEVKIQYSYLRPDELRYWVTFCEANGRDYAEVIFSAKGREVQTFEHGWG